jgi:tetratricopeptide (TPR) repeat protein
VAVAATVLTFAAGETSKPVTVLVNGDLTVEPNETFTVNLSGPSGATIADGTGVGTIVNDDIVQGCARCLKRDALALLSSLQVSDKHDQKKLEEAVEHLTKSLDPELWLDDSHLAKKGEKVFKEEKATANKLRDLKDPPSAVESIVDALVSADEILARTMIQEAIAAGADAHKVAEAQKEMEKARDELAKQHYPQAIDHYGHAWKKAQQALGRAVDDEPDVESALPGVSASLLSLDPPLWCSGRHGAQCNLLGDLWV